jgi:hypothetical protein
MRLHRKPLSGQMKSPVVKRCVVLAGHKTSVSLEDILELAHAHRVCRALHEKTDSHALKTLGAPAGCQYGARGQGSPIARRQA